MQKEYEGLQIEIHEKEIELEKKMKERKILTKEADEIKNKFNDQSKYNDNLDKINTDLQGTFLRLNRQLNSANAKYEVLTKMNSRLKDEIAYLKEAQVEAEKVAFFFITTVYNKNLLLDQGSVQSFNQRTRNRHHKRKA